jgi:two-component system response regulator RegA
MNESRWLRTLSPRQSDGHRALAQVFVVDRDEWGRATLGRHLRSQGYQAVPCATAREFLLYVGQDAFDAPFAPSVALVNSHTLGGETLDLVQALRSSRQDTRVVILTSFSEDEDVIAFLRAGASDYIRLPADPEAVRLVIDRVLALPLVG